MAKRKKTNLPMRAGNYAGLVGEIAQLLEQSRRTAARTVNGILTATRLFYVDWQIAQTPSAQFEARVRLPPAFEIVLLSREIGEYADEAEGRRSREAASFHSPGCSAAEPWVCDRIESVALNGRHSPAPSDLVVVNVRMPVGMTPFQGYWTVSSSNPGLRPGLWNMTPSGSKLVADQTKPARAGSQNTNLRNPA